MRVGKAVEILEKLVGFDTTSRNSNLALIGWVEDYLTSLGIHHERIGGADPTKANLWATIGPADRPGYILSGHTDVVPVDGQTWRSDPFRLTDRGGRLHGRGTTDMKGFLACCLAAVPDMVAAELAVPIHLAFSYDEEVGCVGVRDLVARLQGYSVRPLGCFVGEPTEMRVVSGHKGKRSLRVTVHGRSCHSALAPRGINAVEYAARLIARIAEDSSRRGAEGPFDREYEVPFTTGHTGLVHGGAALNIVPDLCTFEFELRSIPADDPDLLVEEIKTYARDRLEPGMKAVAPEAGFSFELKSGFPGLDLSPEAELAGLARRLSGSSDHKKVPFGTEAGLFAAAGIPAVVIGPGSIDRAHRADEFITLTELDDCGVFLDRLIATCGPVPAAPSASTAALGPRSPSH